MSYLRAFIVSMKDVVFISNCEVFKIHSSVFQMEDYNYSEQSDSNMFKFDQQSTDAVLQAGTGHSTGNHGSNVSPSTYRNDLRASPRTG